MTKDSEREEQEWKCPKCGMIHYYKKDINEVLPCANNPCDDPLLHSDFKCDCDSSSLPYNQIPAELKIRLQ